MVPKCASETVRIHHVLLIVLCENNNVSGASLLVAIHYGKEAEMSRSKRFLAILKDDKKLLGMFGGIVIDVAVLVAIVVTACVWYLP